MAVTTEETEVTVDVTEVQATGADAQVVLNDLLKKVQETVS